MIILDTCAFLWLIQDPKKLSPSALSLLEKDKNLYVVSVTAWEIAIKADSGRLILVKNLSAEKIFQMALVDFKLHEIPVSSKIFCRAVDLPSIHRDPCDRMIIAAAIENKCPIITADRIFSRYPRVKIIW